MSRLPLNRRWFVPVLLSMLTMGCSSRRDVFFRAVSDNPTSGGLELMYSYDAYHWQRMDSVLRIPSIGDGTVKEPSVSKGRDGVYRAIWVATDNGKEGIGCATSLDLKAWTAPVFIRLVTADSTQLTVSAPRIHVDDQTGLCLVYWVSERNGTDCVYGLTTTDFNTCSVARVLFAPGFEVHDPCLVRRAEKDYVLIFGDQSLVESNLKVAFSGSAEGPYDRLSPSFTAYQTRCPSVTKVGAKWLIYLEDYGKNQPSAVTTLDFDSFESVSAEVTVPTAKGSGDIFTVDRKTFKSLLRYRHCKPVKENK